MNTLNPANNQFPEMIKDMGARLSKLENGTQPGFIEYLEINPGATSYAQINAIYINDTAIIGILGVGDVVRINQGGYKYFFIYGIDLVNNGVGLSGGDDYVFTSEPYTEVAVSKLKWPSDFPSLFSYTPVVTSSSMVVSAPNNNGYFYMLGPVVHVSINCSFTLSGTPSSQLQVTVPIEPGFGSDQNGYVLCLLLDAGTWQVGYITSGATNLTVSHINSSTNWTAGAAIFNLTYSYLCEYANV